jgi:hypothetical protein
LEESSAGIWKSEAGGFCEAICGCIYRFITKVSQLLET